MRKKYRVLFLIVLVLVLQTHAMGQSSQQLSPEQTIDKWPPDQNLQAHERHCGDYFVLSNKESADGVPGAFLSYMIELGNGNGLSIRIIQTGLKSKFVTARDDTKLKPTVQFILKEGGGVEKVIVRIAKKDYEAAKDCLPAPQIIIRDLPLLIPLYNLTQ